MAACLSNITEISREECIGNSLPVINDNFTNMKNYVCSLETGIQGIIQQLQFLTPLYGVINFYGDIVLGGVNFELDGKGKQNIVQGIDLRAYHICNGNNGTPDLRDRFVVGSGGTYVHREFGPLYNSTASLAFSSVKLTIPEMPSHNHPSSYTGCMDYGGGCSVPFAGDTIIEYSWTGSQKKAEGSGQGDAGVNKNINHRHSVLLTSEGGDKEHENRPPYMALAYIMRYK